MNRHIRRERKYTCLLSFVIAVILVVESVAGIGITAKAAKADRATNIVSEMIDTSKIHARVVDNKGNSMAGVECQLIDASASNEVIETLKSDADGIVEYSVADLQNGEYRLKVPFGGTHTCKPANGYMYTVADGKVVSVGDKAYTGEEEFVLTPIGGDETDVPQPDEETLVINVTDSEGNPFNEAIFVLVDSEFPTSEGMKKAPQNGILKITVDNNLKSGEVRVASALSDQYEVTPEKIEFTAENKVFTTVNKGFYDGTKTFHMKVVKKDDDSEEKGIITSLKLNKYNLNSEGGMVTLEILGKKLLSNVDVNVYQGTEKLSAVNVLDTDLMQQFTISVPENTSEEQKEYMVTCAIKGDVLSTQYLEFVVEAKTQDGPDEPEDDTNSNAVIAAVEITPEQVTAAGGEVSLKISGTDLAANNWGVQSEVYIQGTDISMTGNSWKVELKDKTKDGATLVIPANSMRNTMEYRIGVGATKNGSISVQKTVTVVQTAKEASVQVNPKQVEATSGNTIIATMEQNVKLGLSDVEAVKNKIYIADYNGTDKVKLTANDVVNVVGDKVTIEFEKMPNLKSTSTLYVEEGAFRTESGVNVKAFSWMIVSNPMITGIELQDVILEYTGGVVNGVLKGVRLSEAPAITAEIFKAGSAGVTNIPVSIGSGNTPSITFEVPQNNTERTESYIINLTMGNTPIYVEEVVSVLPKGESDSTQTLSAMTISGNNKTFTNENSTEIIVKVSPQVGELKTRLNLYGTNLDSKKTEVRAVDQNGVLWPVTHIPE